MPTILVVDDDPNDRELLRALLSASGHTVLEAESAVDGLAMAQNLAPDLIWSDILMPRVDGYEFVRRIRNDHRIAHTPVVFWTGAYYSSGSAVELADALGVRQLLLKPAEPETILDAVTTALAATGTSAPPPGQDEFNREHSRLLTDKLFEHVIGLEDASQRLHVSERQYRQLFEENPFPLWIVDNENFGFLAVNDASIRHYGYSRERFLHMTLADVVIGFAHGDCPRATDISAMHRHRRADGSIIDVDAHRVPTQFDNRNAILVLLADVTERNIAERKLRESEQQLHELATRLRSAQEEERTRVARHLHDELGQALTALKMNIAWFHATYPDPDAALAERVKTSGQLVDEMIDTVRRLATELRPGILDLGIAAAIEWQADEFQKNSGIECIVIVPETDEPMGANCATEIFRIFQEALTNVARHAKATRVDVLLQRDEAGLVLQVTDNGRGITEAEIGRLDALGLLGMRERAALIGGDLSIKGSASGTTVRVWAPCGFGPDGAIKPVLTDSP